MLEIIHGRTIKTLKYNRLVKGEKIIIIEHFFDDVYLSKRIEQINNKEYKVHFSLNQQTSVLDFFDVYLRTITCSKYNDKNYYELVSIVKNYIIVHFDNKIMIEVDKGFVSNLNIMLNSQIAVGYNRYNKENQLISLSVKHKIKQFLKEVFAYATDKGIYKINPMQDLTNEYLTTRFKAEWDLETFNILLKASQGTRLSILIHCLFGTELLIKEILALSWNDIHIDDESFINGTCWIEVSKFSSRKTLSQLSEMKPSNIVKVFPTVKYSKGNTRVTIYKSPVKKQIYITNKIAELLKAWKIEQEKEKKLYKNYDDNNLVIALADGRVCEDRVITKDFEKIKYENQLIDVKLAKLKSFAKNKLIIDETVFTNKEYVYSLISIEQIQNMQYDESHNNSRYSNLGYDWINLKNISIPKQKTIDLMKVVSLLKNNSEFSNELASILNN